MQKTIEINESYEPLDELFSDSQKIFLVCDSSYRFLRIGSYFDALMNVVKFSDFKPNPDYESVKKRLRCTVEKTAAVSLRSAAEVRSIWQNV